MILTDANRNSRAIEQFNQQYDKDFKQTLHQYIRFNNIDNFRLFILPNTYVTTKELFKAYSIDLKTQVVYLIRPIAHGCYGTMEFIKVPKTNKLIRNIKIDGYGTIQRYDVNKHTFVFVADRKSFTKSSIYKDTAHDLYSLWASNKPTNIRVKDIHPRYRSTNWVRNNHKILDESGYNVGAYRYNLIRKRIFKDKKIVDKLTRIKTIENMLKPILADISYTDIDNINNRDMYTYTELTLALKSLFNASLNINISTDTSKLGIEQAVRLATKRLSYTISKIRGHIKYVLNHQSLITDKYKTIFEQILEV